MNRQRRWVIALAACAVAAAALAVVAVVRSADRPSAEGGDAWSAAARVPIPSAAVPGALTIVDPAGRIHVAFVQRRQGTWTLQEIVRSAGGSWSEPRFVAGGRPFPISISALGANRRGDTAVTWIYGGDRRTVALASVRAAEGAWAPEQAVSRVSAGRSQTTVGIDDAGVATVLGRGLGGPGLWTTRLGAAGWERLMRISPAGFGTDRPSLSVSPDCTVDVLALLKRPDRPRMLWSRRADSSGRWSEGTRLPGSEGARPDGIATGADGGAVAAWTLESPGRSRRVAAHRPADGDWSDPVTLDSGTQQLGVAALSAENHGATVTWVRWDARPQDRAVSIRSASIGAAHGAVDTVASLRLAPVGGPPGSVIYGPPPVALLTAGGGRGVTLWAATAEGREQSPARIRVALRHGAGTGPAPTALGTSGRMGLPAAIGATPEGAVAVWSESPALAAATALYTSETGG